MKKDELRKIRILLLTTFLCFGCVTTAYADSTQKMVITAEAKDNRRGPDASTFKVTGYTGTYDGKEHTFGSVMAGDGAAISYSRDGGKTWQSTKPMVKDVRDSATWQIRATLNDKSIFTTADLKVEQKEANITVKNATKKSGEADPIFEASESGFIAGERPDYTVYRTQDTEEAGTYSRILDVRFNGAHPNYNISVKKGTLTITESDKGRLSKGFEVTGYSGTYDGREHTLSVKGVNGAEIDYSKDGKVWTDTKPVATDVNESATWEVRETLNGSSLIKKADLSIRPKEATISVKNATKISGEEEPDYEASVKGVLTNEYLDYTIYRTDSSEKAGKHKDVLSAKLNRDYPNYKVNVIKGSLTITENEFERLEDEFEVHGYNGYYDGKTHGVTVEGAGNAKVEFSTDGASWNTSNVKVKDVADSTHVMVRATIDKKSVYDEADVTVCPLPVTVKADNALYELGKSEPKYTATVTGALGNDRISYEVYRNPADTDTAGLHPGVLLVKLTGNDPNYSVTAEAGHLLITEGGSDTKDGKDGNGIKIEKYEGEYDGRAHTVTVTGADRSDIEYSTDGKAYSTKKPYAKNVEDSTDVSIKTGSREYKSSITIEPDPVTISVNEATMRIGGEEPELTAEVSGLINQEMIEYELFIDREAKNYPKEEKPGRYEGVISAKVKEDSDVNRNYDITVVPGTLNLTSGAEDVRSLKDVTVKSFSGEYDGAKHTITTNVDGNSRFLVEYSTDGKDWSKVAPVAKNVSDSVKAKVRIGLNGETKTVDADLTIKPRKATISVNNAEKKKGEKDPEFSAKVTGLAGKETIDYIIIRDTEDGQPDKPGEHIITAKLNKEYPNYEITIIPAVLTIHNSGIPKAAKAIGGAVAVTVAAGVLGATGKLGYLWMLLLGLVFKKRRKGWHGILTAEENRFIVTEKKSGEGLMAQDIIDRCETAEEALRQMKESGDMTYLPCNTEMEICYVDKENNSVVDNGKADEEELYKRLSDIRDCGSVNVTLKNRKAGFEIPLVFKT